MAWGDTRRVVKRPGQTSAFKSSLRAAGGGSLSAGVGIANTGMNQYGDTVRGSGQPELGAYQGISTLGSKGVYTPEQLGGEQLNRLSTTGLEALTARATGTGPSAWANMMTERQAVEQAAQADAAARTAGSQTAAARSALARSGGLRGGAAERLAGKGAEAALMARQEVLRQGALDRANIGVEDERTRMEMLSRLPGAELEAAKYKSGLDIFNTSAANEAGQFNVSNRIQDLGAANQWRQGLYGEQMKGYAAGKTAEAIQASAPGKPTGGTLGKWGREIGSAGKWIGNTVSGAFGSRRPM